MKLRFYQLVCVSFSRLIRMAYENTIDLKICGGGCEELCRKDRFKAVGLIKFSVKKPQLQSLSITWSTFKNSRWPGFGIGCRYGENQA